ncbi:MoaD/ThiS family protein [Inquilinus limosus]|uniref:Molybdopterin synthase sulfur carrier subunit n=1 Tax=Inquilinus limosus TaxID=171674 RepID=A0A211ZPI9_9PROT|nr:MoaD/ThiS family protein [Inquilinus limosus]OWJ67084.1 molybdopterin synthase sulfur carrier subunit [Inquilinus limosus]
MAGLETQEAPAVRVRLPTALTILFPGAPPRVELHAATVAEAIDGLNERWPGMGDRIRDTRPAIRRHINIFVDGRKARLDTRLAPGAEVFVLTAISGG